MDLKITQLPEKWIKQGYKIVEKVGEGAFGTVYKIKNQNKISALKVVEYNNLSRFAQDLYDGNVDEAIIAYEKQFELEANREIEFLKQFIGIENIVQYRDSYIEKDVEKHIFKYYIEMEYLIKLSDYIKQHKRFDLKQVLLFGIHACDALSAVHSKGMIHRDIKPSNFMVSTSKKYRVYKLVDFGVAKEKFDGLGTIIGTNDYMAPEVFNTQQYDKRADIYSLGLVLYYLMNNNRPASWQISDVYERQEKRFEEGLPYISKSDKFERCEKNTNVNKWIMKIIRKATKENPEERYLSAEDMRKDLMSCFCANYKKK